MLFEPHAPNARSSKFNFRVFCGEFLVMSAKPKPDPQFEIEFFEAIHRRCPDYVDVVGRLGALYTKVGRIADGLKMDRKLVKREPDNATAHYNLACFLAPG